MYAVGFTSCRHHHGSWKEAQRANTLRGPYETRQEADWDQAECVEAWPDAVVLQRAKKHHVWRVAPGQTYRDTVPCATPELGDDCPDCDGQGHRTHSVVVDVPPADR